MSSACEPQDLAKKSTSRLALIPRKLTSLKTFLELRAKCGLLMIKMIVCEYARPYVFVSQQTMIAARRSLIEEKTKYENTPT